LRAFGERHTHPVQRVTPTPYPKGGATRRRPEREPQASTPKASAAGAAGEQRPDVARSTRGDPVIRL